MKLHLIAAVSENFAIGKDSQLPWKLSDDLKLFKRLTLNQTVVMGRKTYESISRPLPHRMNCILSSTLIDEHLDGAHVFCDKKQLDEFLSKQQQVFIIGGSSLYQMYLQQADFLHLSRVQVHIEAADAFFPNIHWQDWQLMEQVDYCANEDNQYPWSYQLWKKKEKND